MGDQMGNLENKGSSFQPQLSGQAVIGMFTQGGAENSQWKGGLASDTSDIRVSRYTLLGKEK